MKARKMQLATELSKFVRETIEANTETSLEWKLLGKTKSDEAGSRNCMLCLREKHPIVLAKLNLK